MSVLTYMEDTHTNLDKNKLKHTRYWHVKLTDNYKNYKELVGRVLIKDLLYDDLKLLTCILCKYQPFLI